MYYPFKSVIIAMHVCTKTFAHAFISLYMFSYVFKCPSSALLLPFLISTFTISVYRLKRTRVIDTLLRYDHCSLPG